MDHDATIVTIHINNGQMIQIIYNNMKLTKLDIYFQPNMFWIIKHIVLQVSNILSRIRLHELLIHWYTHLTSLFDTKFGIKYKISLC